MTSRRHFFAARFRFGFCRRRNDGARLCACVPTEGSRLANRLLSHARAGTRAPATFIVFREWNILLC